MLYICNIPINTTKYGNNGDIVLVTESPALNIACVNSGLIFAFINNGIRLGANIDHLVTDDVWNKLTTANNKKNNIINAAPEKFEIPNISAIFK